MIHGGLAEAMLMLAESPFKTGVKVRFSGSGVGYGVVLRDTVVERGGRNFLRVKVRFENGSSCWLNASDLELAE